jgi:ankyrin repeat protein
MAAAISGYLDTVEKLLSLGANIYLKSCNDLTALEWAKRFSKSEITELLECYQ